MILKLFPRESLSPYRFVPKIRKHYTTWLVQGNSGKALSDFTDDWQVAPWAKRLLYGSAEIVRQNRLSFCLVLNL